jgi:HEAT repeats
MSQVSQLSPELAKGLLQLSRAILAATRNWTLYPPEHPAVGQSVASLADALKAAAAGQMLAIGVTPDTLIVEGAQADRNQAAFAGLAALLHDRDVLQLTITGEVPPDALRVLLKIFALDAVERRARGGPAPLWQAEGHPAIHIEQIDYKKVLERDEDGDNQQDRRARDDLWRSIVTSIVAGLRVPFDERAQQRLLAIAGSPADIGDLATSVMAPKCAPDGSPMITSQAATVLAAFRHLSGIVKVMAPERMPAVLNNIATAASHLDPHVVMQMMRNEDEPDAEVAVVAGVAAAFDDAKVAQLLATALALDGQATDRLATIFNTIAPDDERKRRVLTMTRDMLSETDFGRSGQFQTLWTSIEELLVSYNDKPFVSDTYRNALDNVGGRAERMAAVDLPPELEAWVETLGQDNVRALSVSLLIDLLGLEREEGRASSIAQDMEALAEDLIMGGAYADAQRVVTAIHARTAATGREAIGRDACRAALDRLGESLAMRETAALIGDVDDADWAVIQSIIKLIGPPAAESLKPVVGVETETQASRRAESLLVAFGGAVVSRLSSLVADSRWSAQLAGARILGAIGTADAVPLLQPLLRKTDPRVAREAIAALGGIPDASAARAIHTVLRSATGELRRVVVDALVADRDPRVVPMLVRILDESEAMGKDHDVVLDALGALGAVGHDDAIPALVTMSRRTGWFGRGKRRALKARAVSSLRRLGTARATAALDDAAVSGDRLLKKIINAPEAG